MATVAEIVAKTLRAYGTTNYFCLTGGDHDLWVALTDAGIRIVNCRSENSAVYMADGYARVSGRPGFVYGQRGPGVANVAAAMADPYWAFSPVVSLTTSIMNRSRDRYEYQDVDGMPMHAPTTRWNKSLSSPARAGAMTRAAIRAATGPVPGPVHFEIPADMLGLDSGESEGYQEEALGTVNSRRLAADVAAVPELVTRLLQAERPLILAGNGVILSEAWEELSALAEALNIPVATTLGGKGAISELDSELAVGVVGRYSRRVANETATEADMVFAVGTRFGGLATNGWQLPFQQKRILQLDADPQVIGQNYRVEYSLVGDAKLTLAAILAEVKERGAARGRTPWANDVIARVAKWRAAAQEMAQAKPADGLHPAEVVAAVRAVMKREDLLAADTGAIAAWAGTLFPTPAGRCMLRSAGSLGWVLPGALGAALAAPQRKTVALSGDGGLLYHIGELETAIRCNIPLMIVVINNRAFASEYHLQKRSKHGRIIPEVIDFSDADFAAIARGFGAHGVRVTKSEELLPALREAYALGKPALVDVLCSKDTAAPSASYRGDSLV